jgi:ubiquinone/menaquinone biosynthesis C-methylase UbiE
MRPVQTDKQHYQFGQYVQLERWSSYWHQLDELIRLQPKSVLEVGAGDGVVADYLKKHAGVAHTSVDIAEDLQPDIVGEIEHLPVADKSFDVACAFEVLEHIPFERFTPALTELVRVARTAVVISVPHWGRHFSIEVRLPFFKRVRWQWKMPWLPITHKFNGQHYWEVGKKGYDVPTVIRAIEAAGLRVERHYIAFESPYHHFFILRPSQQ